MCSYSNREAGKLDHLSHKTAINEAGNAAHIKTQNCQASEKFNPRNAARRASRRACIPEIDDVFADQRCCQHRMKTGIGRRWKAETDYVGSQAHEPAREPRALEAGVAG
jgi:hypothetical protein